LEYQLLEKGKVVATGTLLLNDYCCRAGSGWEYVGFRGGGFDEVRLQDTSVYATFDPNMPPTSSRTIAWPSLYCSSNIVRRRLAYVELKPVLVVC
jgi:hypothetical protein